MGDPLSLLAHYSYAAIFALLLGCGAGLPLSEDAILVAAGVLAAKGTLHPGLAVVAGYLGVLAGDLLLYFIGRKLGRRALTHRRLGRLLPPARVAALSARFHRLGPWAVVAARLLPGTRTATFLSAGVLDFPLGRFVAADGAAALLSVPATVLLAGAGAGALGAHLAPLKAALPWALGFALSALGLRWAVAQWRPARS